MVITSMSQRRVSWLSYTPSVSAGAVVKVLEDDDGSGWVKVSDTNGEKGLVPATYLEPFEESGDTSSYAATNTSTIARAQSIRQAPGSGMYGK